ncbi:MAG TPA: hypothetical protein VF857_00950, partial [Spirochaetota bacterium]
IAKTCAVVAITSLVFATHLAVFIIASFLIGIARGVNQLAYPPAVKLLSRKNDMTDYFALTQLFALPFSFVIPFLSGIVIDSLHTHGAAAYQITFSCLALIACSGTIFLLRTDFSPPQ